MGKDIGMGSYVTRARVQVGNWRGWLRVKDDSEIERNDDREIESNADREI